LEEERQAKMGELLEALAEGDVRDATVARLVDYGAFVDLGGLDALLHVTDMSWGRVGHPGQHLRVGEELRVKVLKIDRAKGRVSVGVKQLTEDPWLRVRDRYAVGQKVSGRVVTLADYG